LNRILIAEQEPLIARFLERRLESQGYVTANAADGDQALEMAKSGLFDLLLLDLRLPGRSGLDVLSRLRPRSRLPVIALSERNAPAQIVAALEAGADDCMSKPYAFAELLARVRVRLRPRLARAAAG
jgi:DNA-binding response OmpR family regulator